MAESIQWYSAYSLYKICMQINIYKKNDYKKKKKNWSTDNMNFEVHFPNITYTYCNPFSHYTQF